MSELSAADANDPAHAGRHVRLPNVAAAFGTEPPFSAVVHVGWRVASAAPEWLFCLHRGCGGLEFSFNSWRPAGLGARLGRPPVKGGCNGRRSLCASCCGRCRGGRRGTGLPGPVGRGYGHHRAACRRSRRPSMRHPRGTPYSSSQAATPSQELAAPANPALTCGVAIAKDGISLIGLMRGRRPVGCRPVGAAPLRCAVCGQPQRNFAGLVLNAPAWPF